MSKRLRDKVKFGRTGGTLPEPTLGLNHEGLIIPLEPPAQAADVESQYVWGFDDTRFEINERGSVEMTGSRYAISGQELPNLLPWMENVINIQIDPFDKRPTRFSVSISAPKKQPAFIKALKKALPQERFSQDDQLRLRHGHGHTQAEMYALKSEGLFRVPDAVFRPQSEDELDEIRNRKPM